MATEEYPSFDEALGGFGAQSIKEIDLEGVQNDTRAH
jgi:hypothetical protein